MFWSGETIREWVPRWDAIKPFDENKIDCAAYTLTMGSEVYVTPDYQVSRLSTHTKRNLVEGEHFIIPPGQFAFLLTEETVRIPPDVLGFISLRSTYKFRGLINVSGFHVDPGFYGKLIYAVYNAGPSPVHLARGDALFLIWFADLDRLAHKYTRDEPPQTTISPRMITDVGGEILTLQSLSKKIGDLEKTWFQIKFIGSTVVVFAGLIYTAIKFWDTIYAFIQHKT